MALAYEQNGQKMSFLFGFCFCLFVIKRQLVIKLVHDYSSVWDSVTLTWMEMNDPGSACFYLITRTLPKMGLARMQIRSSITCVTLWVFLSLDNYLCSIVPNHLFSLPESWRHTCPFFTPNKIKVYGGLFFSPHMLSSSGVNS